MNGLTKGQERIARRIGFTDAMLRQGMVRKNDAYDYDAVAPAGFVFAASDCHVLVAAGDRHIEVWSATCGRFTRDLDAGLLPCRDDADGRCKRCADERAAHPELYTS